MDSARAAVYLREAMHGNSPRLQRAPGWLLLVTIAFVIASVAPAMAGKPKGGKTTTAASASASAPTGAPPLAQSLTGQAKADYDAARVLYGDGDYAGALVKFSGAYDQSRDPRLLWNMGACEKNLRHYARVLALVRRYLAEGGPLLTEQDRQESRDLLSTVEAFTAFLKITVNEEGAAVFIDDEPVGKSPLPAPVLVDLGTRKVRVEKPGFVTQTSSVPVGGNKEIGVEVQLVKEVHEGKLTVRAGPGATIKLDGKDVGSGAWTGAIPSGGHSLQVTAPGMLPYQSDVMIQDGENRVVEVSMTRIPEQQSVVIVKQKEEPKPIRAFELGLRSGYGLVYPMSDASSLGSSAFVPFALEVGQRRGNTTHFSVFLQYAPYDRSNQCGINRHGPTPASAGDLQERYSYTDCYHVAGGIQFLFHTLPSLVVDPWLGFDVGAQYSVRKYKSFDPLTLQPSTGQDGGPSAAIGAQLGVDFHVYKGLSVGPYTRLAVLLGEDLKPKSDASSTTTASPYPSSYCPAGAQCTSDGENKSGAIWPQFTFGLRVGYVF